MGRGQKWKSPALARERARETPGHSSDGVVGGSVRDREGG